MPGDMAPRVGERARNTTGSCRTPGAWPRAPGSAGAGQYRALHSPMRRDTGSAASLCGTGAGDAAGGLRGCSLPQVRSGWLSCGNACVVRRRAALCVPVLSWRVPCGSGGLFPRGGAFRRGPGLRRGLCGLRRSVLCRSAGPPGFPRGAPAQCGGGLLPAALSGRVLLRRMSGGVPHEGIASDRSDAAAGGCGAVPVCVPPQVRSGRLPGGGVPAGLSRLRCPGRCFPRRASGWPGVGSLRTGPAPRGDPAQGPQPAVCPSGPPSGVGASAVAVISQGGDLPRVRGRRRRPQAGRQGLRQICPRVRGPAADLPALQGHEPDLPARAEAGGKEPDPCTLST